MEPLFRRYRNLALLGLLMAGQLILLGYQVRRPDAGGVRLLRIWTVQTILPVEQASGRLFGGFHAFFRDYIALWGVRRRNRQLREEMSALRLSNDQLRAQFRELPNLEALLAFRETYINKTMPARVIGNGPSADAQVIFLNRGSLDGVHREMPVITPQGVVGKVTEVYNHYSTVQLISDAGAGLGATVEATGVNGVLRGIGTGKMKLTLVMNGDPVAVGAKLVTSGQDQIFPRGLPVGTVSSVHPGTLFQQIQVVPAVPLGRLDRVLIITQMGASPFGTMQQDQGSGTAAALRQAKLPSVPANAVGPQTGPPLPYEELVAERQAAAKAAAMAANAVQLGKPLPTPTPAPTAAPPPASTRVPRLAPNLAAVKRAPSAPTPRKQPGSSPHPAPTQPTPEPSPTPRHLRPTTRPLSHPGQPLPRSTPTPQPK